MKLTKHEREMLSKALELVDRKQGELPETGKCSREQRALLERLLDVRSGIKAVLAHTAEF